MEKARDERRMIAYQTEGRIAINGVTVDLAARESQIEEAQAKRLVAAKAEREEREARARLREATLKGPAAEERAAKKARVGAIFAKTSPAQVRLEQKVERRKELRERRQKKKMGYELGPFGNVI